jgi:hypothetical protein
MILYIDSDSSTRLQNRRELGLKVDAVRFNGASYGSYNPIRKEIKLASPEIEIFLHELSHAVDDRLNGLEAG